jgi:hypothetical protein
MFVFYHRGIPWKKSVLRSSRGGLEISRIAEGIPSPVGGRDLAVAVHVDDKGEVGIVRENFRPRIYGDALDMIPGGNRGF